MSEMPIIIREKSPSFTEDGKEMFRQFVIEPGLGFDGEGGVKVEFVPAENPQDHI